MTLRRIKQEWLNLQNDPLPTCSAVPKNEDDMLHWTGTISGPSDTPYRDGVFHLKIRLPEIYPRVSPELTFTTPIFHPNVSTQGDIQLGELDRMQWSPVLTIRTLLISLQALLSDPNLAEGCVLNEEAAKLYLDDPKGFQERARERTVSHAMSGGAGL
jgi:ubiquitin-conjugating enzyme E2 D/E